MMFTGKVNTSYYVYLPIRPFFANKRYSERKYSIFTGNEDRELLLMV